MIKLLNHLFSAFDELSDANGIFKVRDSRHRRLETERRLQLCGDKIATIGMRQVETIGDAYMAAAGHYQCPDHALRVTRFALDMIKAAESVPISLLPEGFKLEIRVGIHTGPAQTPACLLRE